MRGITPRKEETIVFIGILGGTIHIPNSKYFEQENPYLYYAAEYNLTAFGCKRKAFIHSSGKYWSKKEYSQSWSSFYKSHKDKQYDAARIAI